MGRNEKPLRYLISWAQTNGSFREWDKKRALQAAKNPPTLAGLPPMRSGLPGTLDY